MLTLRDIKKYGQKNGLQYDWNVKIKDLNHVNAWAITSLEDRYIYLDPEIFEKNDEDIKQIMLHEIAHTFFDKYEYHGKAWQEKASEIGVNIYFMRYDWARVKTPTTVFYINYHDAKHCCDNDIRCMEIARNQHYYYDMDRIYRIPDKGVFTRSKIKKLLNNETN